jgi:hypothetical protein
LILTYAVSFKLIQIIKLLRADLKIKIKGGRREVFAEQNSMIALITRN